MKLARIALVAAVLILTPVACGDGDPGVVAPPEPPKAPNVVGSYNLVTVDGQPVPAGIILQGVTVVIESSRMNLQPGGAASVALSASGPGGSIQNTTSGRWRQSGSSVTLEWNEGCTDTAVYRDDTLTLRDCSLGNEMVYRK